MSQLQTMKGSAIKIWTIWSLEAGLLEHGGTQYVLNKYRKIVKSEEQNSTREKNVSRTHPALILC
jgi:hypothetical protein